jgi:predicted ATPase/Flp pilus assembly protein TadD
MRGRKGVVRLSVEGITALKRRFQESKYTSVDAFCQKAGVPKSTYYDLLSRKKWFEETTVQNNLIVFGVSMSEATKYCEYRDAITEPSSNISRQPTSFIGREKEITEVPVRSPDPASPPPRSIPAPITALVGRREEVRQIKARLLSARLVTLTGAGGVGKTRLAIQVADEVADDYNDGVWFVELAALEDPRLITQTILRAMDVHVPPEQPLLETLRQHLEPRALLLVLDNCEHIAQPCAELAEHLLRSCRALRILATSRQSLGLPGEVLQRVPSLSLLDPQHLPSIDKNLVHILEKYEAIQLFVERVLAIRPDFYLTPQNLPLVAQICNHLDGIPLALELAAARAISMPVEQIALRLDDRFGLLTRGNSAALPRQKTLKAALDWSYDLLSDQEQILLCRLSVFAGGWTPEALGGGCAVDTRIHKWDVFDLLTSLVDKSLVVDEERNGQARYRLLETVRQYGRKRLAESGESNELRARHCDFYLELAEIAQPKLRGQEQSIWIDRLEREQDNLRAALDWSFAEADRTNLGLRLAVALAQFWLVRGLYAEGRFWLTKATEQFSSASVNVLATAYIQLGQFEYYQGDYIAARMHYQQCLTLRRECGNAEVIAEALAGLGLAAQFGEGDYITARAYYEQALEALQISDGGKTRFHVLRGLGILNIYQGDYEGAQRCLESCLAGNRALGDALGVARCLNLLATATRELGDSTRARRLYQESLAVSLSVSDRWGSGSVKNGQGCVAYVEGDYEQARALFEQSLGIMRGLDTKEGIATVANNLAMIFIQQHDIDAARALCEESLLIKGRNGSKQDVASSLERFAAVAVLSGQHAKALRLLAAAAALRKSVGVARFRIEQSDYDNSLTTIRATISEESFGQIWSEGGAMLMEQAIGYALESAMD